MTSAAPGKNPFSTSEKRPPLGLGFLISVVRNAGHKVFFIDNYLSPEKFIEGKFLSVNKIDIVGIYSNTICFESTIKMLQDIQELRINKEWGGILVVGGPHVSVAIGTIPDYVDFIVYGEGEKAILDIINGSASERIIKNPPNRNLDALPFQPWDIFTKLEYDFTSRWFNERPVFTMNTSRGCPFDCSFCSVGGIWGRQYTYFSAERIIEEILFLKENYRARGIYFREDNFTLNTRRIEKFCRLIVKKGIDITWACETRVDNITRELLKSMSEAGCRALYLGVESGSRKILDLLNKSINTDQVENVVNWGKEFNIRTYCSLIAGVPGESVVDLIKTYMLMRRIKPYSYAFNIFVGLPGSALYRKIYDEKSYEFMDGLGLLYMPGFDVKTEYFYRSHSSEYIDYKFKKRKLYDRILQIVIVFRKIKNLLRRIKGKSRLLHL